MEKGGGNGGEIEREEGGKERQERREAVRQHTVLFTVLNITHSYSWKRCAPMQWDAHALFKVQKPRSIKAWVCADCGSSPQVLFHLTLKGGVCAPFATMCIPDREQPLASAALPQPWENLRLPCTTTSSGALLCSLDGRGCGRPSGRRTSSVRRQGEDARRRRGGCAPEEERCQWPGVPDRVPLAGPG